MKKEEVPQDKSNLESAHFRELCYAVDEDGEYTTTNSTGWEPKTIALDNAIKALEERADDARRRVRAGTTSPVEFYMELRRMDPGILASYMGCWSWRIRRHFKPAIFKRLPEKTLRRYAEVFEIPLDDLRHFKY